MKKVGIVSCDKWLNKITEDRLLKESLLSKGFDTHIISWEDKNCNFNDYDILIIRSVWGYQNKYKEFKEWLERIKREKILLVNNPDIIFNNIRKDKQFEILDKNNIPHINTEFVYDFDSLIKVIGKNCVEVLKPIISGSGERTIKILNDTNKEELINDIIELYNPVFNEEDNGVMIQPFINEINNGEYACIYINGKNTHNMIRYPGVFSSKQKPKLVYDIPSDVKLLADKVASLEEYKDYLYMRVDVVVHDNSPLIMEVELAEPDLLFKYVLDEDVKKSGVNELSKQLIRRVKG